MLPTTNHQSDLEQKLLTVTKMIAEAHIRAEERAKAAHERFNVFTTLLGENDEVLLHTRFLHCLLDPKAGRAPPEPPPARAPGPWPPARGYDRQGSDRCLRRRSPWPRSDRRSPSAPRSRCRRPPRPPSRCGGRDSATP